MATYKGKVIAGLSLVAQTKTLKKYTSFRLVNIGSTSASVTMYVNDIPITPMRFRLDPGDMALDQDVDIDMEVFDRITITSDSGDVTYFVTLT